MGGEFVSPIKFLRQRGGILRRDGLEDAKPPATHTRKKPRGDWGR